MTTCGDYSAHKELQESIPFVLLLGDDVDLLELVQYVTNDTLGGLFEMASFHGGTEGAAINLNTGSFEQFILLM